MKTKSLIVSAFLLTMGATAYAQDNVGINATGATPDGSAMLDITSTDKGLLIPRLTSVQRTGITAPANGLLVFDIDESGFYFYDLLNTAWKALAGSTTTNTGAADPTLIYTTNGF